MERQGGVEGRKEGESWGKQRERGWKKGRERQKERARRKEGTENQGIPSNACPQWTAFSR